MSCHFASNISDRRSTIQPNIIETVLSLVELWRAQVVPPHPPRKDILVRYLQKGEFESYQSYMRHAYLTLSTSLSFVKEYRSYKSQKNVSTEGCFILQTYSTVGEKDKKNERCNEAFA